MNVTTVAVVVPARDRVAVLGRALESVRAQTRPADEIIVVDDGSTDGTSAVAAAFGVTVLVNEQPMGSGPARNRGVSVANSEWIAFLDSDDEWMVHHLETLLAYVDGVDLVAGATIDNFGRRRGWLGSSPQPVSHEMLFFPENVISTSGVLVRRAIVDEVGGFRNFDRAEDLDLWIRVLSAGRGLALPAVTSRYFRTEEYFSTTLHARGRQGSEAVVAAFIGEPWLNSRLLEEIDTRAIWDDIRSRVFYRSRAGRARSYLVFFAHRRRYTALFRLLRYRWRARHGLATGWLRFWSSCMRKSK